MTLMLGLIHITPTPQVLMIQYNGLIASQLAVDNVTLDGHTSSQYGGNYKVQTITQGRNWCDRHGNWASNCYIQGGSSTGGNIYAFTIVEFGHRNEDNNPTSMDANYGSEDLPMHGNKKGSPCGETKGMANAFKGII